MEVHPEYVLLCDPVTLFVDDERHAMLVVAGEIDRYEMADRAYLAVAPTIGIGEMEERLRRDAGNQELGFIALALRVNWCSLRTAGDGVQLGPYGSGAPVTVCSLLGLVWPEEIIA